MVHVRIQHDSIIHTLLTYTDYSDSIFRKKALLRDEDGEMEEVSDDDEIEMTEFTLQRGQSAKLIKKCQNCKIGLWTPQDPDFK